MKNAAICFVSMLLGAGVVLWLQGSASSLPSVSAQPPGASATARQGKPGTVTKSISLPGSTDDSFLGDALSDIAAPRVFDSQGMAPDEAVSAFVYEANNRSVANIATRIGAARGLFGDNPTSDSGSGFILDRAGHILTNKL